MSGRSSAAARVSLLLAATACLSDSDRVFESEYAVDTVAVVGAADETHALFVARVPVPTLVDDRAMVYVDGGVPGRMVVVDLPEGQEVSQGIRALGRSGEVLWTTDEGIPRLRYRTVRRDGSRIRFEAESGGGLIVAARGSTIAWAMYGGRTLTVLDTLGAVRARRELRDEIWDVLIDADERVWAKVLTRDERGVLGNIAFDRDLKEQFRIALHHIRDASGRFVLTLHEGDLDEDVISLLEMRPIGG